MSYNVAYYAKGSVSLAFYCQPLPTREQAEHALAQFIARYGNGLSNLKPYPNGVFHHTMPHIVEIHP
jgi:hypothetical protein